MGGLVYCHLGEPKLARRLRAQVLASNGTASATWREAALNQVPELAVGPSTVRAAFGSRQVLGWWPV